MTDDRAAGADGIPAAPDEVTRLVCSSSVVFGASVYTHMELTAYEGRRVVVQRIGEDGPVRVLLEGLRDISCRRIRPAGER